MNSNAKSRRNLIRFPPPRPRYRRTSTRAVGTSKLLPRNIIKKHGDARDDRYGTSSYFFFFFSPVLCFVLFPRYYVLFFLFYFFIRHDDHVPIVNYRTEIYIIQLLPASNIVLHYYYYYYWRHRPQRARPSAAPGRISLGVFGLLRARQRVDNDDTTSIKSTTGSIKKKKYNKKPSING